MLLVITDIEFKNREIRVLKNEHGSYFVEVNGIDKHGICAAEDVMRVMAFYMHDDSVSKDNQGNI